VPPQTPAEPRAAPGWVDREGDLGVTPLAVQPGVADHGAVVIADPPPLVGHRLLRGRRGETHRGQFGRAEHLLFAGVPAGRVLLGPAQAHQVSLSRFTWARLRSAGRWAPARRRPSGAARPGGPC